MAGWADVCEIAAALPGAEEGTTFGNAAWKLRGKPFVWERPLRSRDLQELGDAAPIGSSRLGELVGTAWAARGGVR